jgi:ribonuclease PH
MKEQGVSGGWITAEYSMLPYSTLTRRPRDVSKGKLDGRSVEIQRLIGRALRAAVDLDALGERTLWIDCDVLQADGGTRTASITGASVAVALACAKLRARGQLTRWPIRCLVAAVSVGVVDERLLLDLNYEEDKNAAVDLNVVMTSKAEFVEVQGAGEESTFSRGELDQMIALGEAGIQQLIASQRELLRSNAVEIPGED